MILCLVLPWACCHACVVALSLCPSCPSGWISPIKIQPSSNKPGFIPWGSVLVNVSWYSSVVSCPLLSFLLLLILPFLPFSWVFFLSLFLWCAHPACLTCLSLSLNLSLFSFSPWACHCLCVVILCVSCPSYILVFNYPCSWNPSAFCFSGAFLGYVS